MKTVSIDLIRELVGRAEAAPRRRTNHNLHPTLDDPVQRFFNVLQPGTYLRPHRHRPPAVWEAFVVVSGRAVALRFSDDGVVTDRCELSPIGPCIAVELPGEVWHSLAVLEPSTVLFELKPGPYRPLTDKDFAPWAPAEGDGESASFARWQAHAAPGDSYRSDRHGG